MPKTWKRKLIPSNRLVEIPAVVVGPLGRKMDARFVLDTGSEVTILNSKLAEAIDLTRGRSEGPSRLWGPTGPDDGYKARAVSIEMMGGTLENYQIRCHDLWAGAGVDGLVGLDIISLGAVYLDIPWLLFEFRWK